MLENENFTVVPEGITVESAIKMAKEQGKIDNTLFAILANDAMEKAAANKLDLKQKTQEFQKKLIENCALANIPIPLNYVLVFNPGWYSNLWFEHQNNRLIFWKQSSKDQNYYLVDVF